MEEYKDVDEVTMVFAQNGVLIQFWGRFDDGCLEKFTMIYPDVPSAMEVVDQLCKIKQKKDVDFS